MIVDLPAGWPEVLGAVVAGPGAWASAASIAERISIREESAGERCRGLERLGWLASFYFDDATVFTLTDDSAGRLAVVLEPDRRGDGEHWARTSAKPVMLRSRHRQPFDETPIAELVVDPSPGPAELAEQREELERYLYQLLASGVRRRPVGDPPWPIVHLTGSATVWREWGYSPRGCNYQDRKGVWRSRPTALCVKPGTRPRPPASCDACLLDPLPTSYDCLRCGRWGWDEFFAVKTARGKTA